MRYGRNVAERCVIWIGPERRCGCCGHPRPRGARVGRIARRRVASVGRQPHEKSCALTECAVHGNRSAEHLDVPMRDRETEAAAARLAGERAVGLPEWIE